MYDKTERGYVEMPPFKHCRMCEERTGLMEYPLAFGFQIMDICSKCRRKMRKRYRKEFRG